MHQTHINVHTYNNRSNSPSTNLHAKCFQSNNDKERPSVSKFSRARIIVQYRSNRLTRSQQRAYPTAKLDQTSISAYHVAHRSYDISSRGHLNGSPSQVRDHTELSLCRVSSRCSRSMLGVPCHGFAYYANGGFPSDIRTMRGLGGDSGWNHLKNRKIIIGVYLHPANARETRKSQINPSFHPCPAPRRLDSSK